MIKKIWIMHAFKRSKFGTLHFMDWVKEGKGFQQKLILSNIEKVGNKFLIAMLYF